MSPLGAGGTLREDQHLHACPQYNSASRMMGQALSITVVEPICIKVMQPKLLHSSCLLSPSPPFEHSYPQIKLISYEQLKFLR